MTTDYRAAVDELLNALYKVQDWDGSRVGGAMDAVERATLTQPEPEHHPTWTEGVCGEGAAILKDGVMQPIEDVIAALNATTLAQPEPSADGEVAELADRLGWIAAQLGDIGWGDDSASVARAANLLQQQAVPVPVDERLPVPSDELLEFWRQGAIAEYRDSCYKVSVSRSTALQAIAWCRQQQALARWGRPAIQPVPVAERPWEREKDWRDLDGECWWCPSKGTPYWQMANPAMVYDGWLLPAHALPIPQPTQPPITP